MKGALRSRTGTSALRHRCPQCKKLRKFCEPDRNDGGENHPRRPFWGKIDGRWVCGFCWGRANGETTDGPWRTDYGYMVSRDLVTGRVTRHPMG